MKPEDFKPYQWREMRLTSSMLTYAAIDEVTIQRAIDASPNKMVYTDKLKLATTHEMRRQVQRFTSIAEGLIATLHRTHWIPTLCDQIHTSKSGLIGETIGFQVLASAMAGRAMLTINSKRIDAEGVFVSIIAEDGDVCSVPGLQGCYGTAEQLTRLLQDAAFNMPRLSTDSEVTHG